MVNSSIIFKVYFRKSLFLMIGILILLINVNAFEGGAGTLRKSDLINKFNSTSIYEGANNVFDEGIGNDKSKMGYGLGVSMLCFIEMYEATKNKAYLDSAYKYIDLTLQVRDDNRGVITYLDHSDISYSDTDSIVLPLWRNLRNPRYYKGDLPEGEHLWDLDSFFIRRYSRTIDNLSDEKINLEYPDKCFAAPYVVHTAHIIQPMIHFAKMLDSDLLWDEYPLSRDNYLSEIALSINAHNDEWLNYGEYKVYVWLTHESIDLIFWRNQCNERIEINNPISINYFASMGSALLRMYEVDQDDEYRRKAYELAKIFHSTIFVDDETNSLFWKYRYCEPESEAYGPEDVSHSRISHKFIYDYFKSSISENYPIFDLEDMERLANTFTRRMFLGDIEHYEWEIVDTIHQWVLKEKDSIYDISGQISGESYDSSSSQAIYYKYYTNYGRQKVVFWIPMCEYDARIYEIAYNICHEYNYAGIKNLLYYYDMYKPCIVSSSPENVLCNHTEDLEIRFNNIKILGDLVVEVSQNDTVYYRGTMQQTKATDTIWNASLRLANFNTKYTGPYQSEILFR